LDISVLDVLFVFLPALGGGIIQTTTGFGFGLFVMMFYPLFLPVTEASALSATMSMLLALTLVVHLRKHLRFKEMVFPLCVDVFFGLVSTAVSAYMDLGLLKTILGVFLILMALYLIFLSGRFAVRANKKTAFVCCTLGGLSGGFFGIGGPPLLPYFLAAYGNEKLTYIVSLQLIFAVTGVSNTVMRVANGIYTLRVLLLAIPGIAAMWIGQMIGLKIINRINAVQLKKIIYVVLGLSGILTFVTSLSV
jgi:uncharacterized membrane protein YfcA